MLFDANYIAFENCLLFELLIEVCPVVPDPETVAPRLAVPVPKPLVIGILLPPARLVVAPY